MTLRIANLLNRRIGAWRCCALVPALLLGACAGAPGGDVTAAGIGPLAAAQSLPAAADASWPAEAWWHGYGDEQLAALIDEGLARSPDVAVAAARLRKAGALAGVAGSALLPSLNVNGTAGFTKQSYNIGYPPQFVALLPHGWKSEGELTASFGFDPDLWGKNRALLAAAVSERRAAAIDAEAARLALATSIADAYAGFAGDVATRDVRAAALDDRVGTQKLIAQRFDQGLETRAAVDSAQATTASARADLAAAQAQVAVRRDQLAALMGEGPDRGLAITEPTLAPLGDRALPAGVTTDLLGRRPDIAAARARAEAAAARIHAARAEYFPSITLNGLAGFQSIGIGQLLAAGSTMGTVGPAISLPVFHGGEIRANYRGARADYDTAVATYDGTVVAAYQQLADAVNMRAQLLRQRAEAQTAADASQAAYKLTRARYEGGLANYLDVLASEDRWLAARASLSALDTAARQSDIALIRALGGGYAGDGGYAGQPVAAPAASQGTMP